MEGDFSPGMAFARASRRLGDSPSGRRSARNNRAHMPSYNGLEAGGKMLMDRRAPRRPLGIWLRYRDEEAGSVSDAARLHPLACGHAKYLLLRAARKPGAPDRKSVVPC